MLMEVIPHEADDMPGKTDWDDFGDIVPAFSGGSHDINPLGVTVIMSQMPNYGEEYRGNYDKVLRQSAKAMSINNDILGLLEKTGQDQRLRLFNLKDYSVYDRNKLVVDLAKEGYLDLGFVVPHSQNGGQWMDRCIGKDESQADYQNRIREMLRNQS